MEIAPREYRIFTAQGPSGSEGGSPNPAREFKQFLDVELNAHQWSTDNLEAGPPSRKATAKRKASKTANKTPAVGNGKLGEPSCRNRRCTSRPPSSAI